MMDIGTIEIPEYMFDLVDIDYRDKLTPEQVEKLIHLEVPDDLDEWVSDHRWDAACHTADHLLADIDHTDDDRYALIERLQEGDTSTPIRDLMRATGMMLFRFSPHEDGMAFLDEELDDPTAACEALGLDESWVPHVAKILPEIAGYRCEGGGWFGATFVFSANPGDLWNWVESGRVTVTDPFLWLTNPYSGNGYGEVAEGKTIELPIADIHVDQFAWGYSANDVFGGLILPDSEITVVKAAEQTEMEDA